MLAGVYLYRRVDEEIRFHVQRVLARHYQGLTVSVRSARLLEREGIAIRGLVISDRSDPSSGTELFFCDEIQIRCQPTLKGLMAGNLNVRGVTARRVNIRTTQLADGTWTLSRLFPLPRFGAGTPPTTVENATLEIVSPAGGAPRLLTLRNINLQLTPRNVQPAERNRVGVKPPTIEIEGALTGDHLQRVELSGWVSPGNGQCSLRGKVFELAISPELRHVLPSDIGRRLEPLGTLSAMGTFDFQAEGDLRQPASVEYRVVGDVHDGRLADSRLAYPLTDLQAHIDADKRVLRIDKASARYGAATLEVSCWRDGYSADSPALVSGAVRGLHFDRKLVDLLSEKLRAEWSKYQPTGTVNADFLVRFDGQQWRPEEIGVQCLDVALRHYKFSYPLRQATGIVALKDDVLTVSGFRALAGDTPIGFEGEIRHPGPDWSGQFTLRSEGTLPLDRPLIEATAPTAQRIIRDFSPRGSVSFVAQVRRQPGRQSPILQDWTIGLHDCGLKHVQFPYPLENVSGQLHLQEDGKWVFSGLSGRNDSADVRCSGGWEPGETGGQLTLHFEARDVPLEPELRDALTPNARDFWNRVRPQGTLDRLNATFTYAQAARQASLLLRVEQLQSLEAQQEAKRSVSIFPVWFPYRVEDLSGVVTYEDGSVTLTQLRGAHGIVPISAEGRGQIESNGAWWLDFDRVVVDRLPVDRELLQAMPVGLRGGVDKQRRCRYRLQPVR